MWADPHSTSPHKRIFAKNGTKKLPKRGPGFEKYQKWVITARPTGGLAGPTDSPPNQWTGWTYSHLGPPKDAGLARPLTRRVVSIARPFDMRVVPIARPMNRRLVPTPFQLTSNNHYFSLTFIWVSIWKWNFFKIEDWFVILFSVARKKVITF